jgi:hypothetical protein
MPPAETEYSPESAVSAAAGVMFVVVMPTNHVEVMPRRRRE